MVWHLVLLKPRVDLEGAAADALVQSFRHAVASIDVIEDVKIGRRVRHGAGYEQAAPDAADYLVALQFKDVGALQSYLAHPAHQELGRRFGESLSGALVYDYEVGGVDVLDALR